MFPWLTIWIARFTSGERFRKATSGDYRLHFGLLFLCGVLMIVGIKVMPQSKPNRCMRLEYIIEMFAILLGAGFCFAHDGVSPRIFTGEAMVGQFSRSNDLECASLLFYSNRLFESAAPGLLEIENGSITKLYRWGRDYSVLDGAWADKAHGLLWVSFGEDEGRLASYDGKNWQEVRFPRPGHGYISRGDALHGFRGVSNSKAFWLEGAGRAWRWQGPRSEKWSEEALPAAFHSERQTDILLKLLIPAEDNVFFIKRGDRDWDWLVALSDSPRMQNHSKRNQVEAEIQGDSAWYLGNGQWSMVTNNDGKFIAEEAMAIKDKGYLRTTKAELFEVAETGVSKVKTPGACEAIAQSSDGTLLASFHGLGVFELKGDWHKLLDNPYAAAEGDFKVLLAAHRECIALAVVPQPQYPLQPRPSLSLPSRIYNSHPGLWVAQGQEWKAVTISPAQ